MRKLTSLELPAWSLPLIALAISVPAVAAFAIGGPGAGMAAGALLAAAILVIAARARFDEEIEVATPPGGERGGVLVVATAPVEGDAAVAAIRDALGVRNGHAPEVLVLAPALNTTLSHWASDLGQARLEAQERLAVSIAELAKAGVEARGVVGDSDAVQAVEDTLRLFPAREVVFVTAPQSPDRVIGEVRRRLDRPVVSVEPRTARPGGVAHGHPRP
jgi:hypothetical protein